ncbi:MAG: transglutaminase domain-containing protein [Siphonobacter sp.]
MKNIRIYLMFGFVVAVLSCKEYSSTSPYVDINTILQSAGSNQIEIRKAIEHYSNNNKDTLKLKALYFLIENMPDHYSYQGKTLEHYNSIFKLIADREKIKPFRGSIHFPEIYALSDSLTRLYGYPHVQALTKQYDHQTITADLLIENIDYAFKAWQLPWSKHLTFDQFCEYVLPYRFQDETLESWRPLFMKKYAWLSDSMKGSTDPVRACELINNDIKKWFRFNEVFFRYPSALSPSSILTCKMGRCLDQAGIATFAMRAMGIPVTHELIPQWGDRSMGHDFSAVLTKQNTFLDFLGGELAPGKNELRSKVPKVYRSLYSYQRPIESEAFTNPFWKDVTRSYTKVARVILPLFHATSIQKGDTIYLAVFNNVYWIPVASACLTSRTVTFDQVGRDIVYLPMRKKHTKFEPVADPVLVGLDGSIVSIRPDPSQSETIHIDRKYPLNGIKLWWMTLMGQGRFQGANHSDFSDAVTLHIIPDTISMTMHRVTLKKPGTFRYVRYLFPDDKYGSLGELAFYSNQALLSGIMLRDSGVADSDATLAFDGQLDQFIHTPEAADYNGRWVGLDLGLAKPITALGYSPRNDRNGIMAGMDYELMYWTSKGWLSLGRQLAKSDQPLTFTRLPKKALLLLHNHTEGKEERIFMYEHGKQVWY